ncbi:MAG: DUF4130 domain-containing protein [Deltaproteobacteria bacterium]|nr:DUF4130 domain-containing protein [Deltaproteobacteria bacterium]
MTTEIVFKPDFVSWRQEARRLLSEGVHPDDVSWVPAGEEQGRLMFAAEAPTEDCDDVHEAKHSEKKGAIARVPRAFMEAAELAAVHREPRRWQVLYRILWRLNHGEPHLLNIEVDDDVMLLTRMAKAVGRDIHKMHAFVRFRKVMGADPEVPDEPVYIAWHCPDHAIFRLAVPFFVRRFRTMTFAILTPDGSAYWDKQHLEYGPGVPEGMAPRLEDELETLWCSYYGAIFNPARIKTKAMKKEMPVRHWRTLPETALIGELLASSEARVAQMLKDQPTSAQPFVPRDASDLGVLKEAATRCSGCKLCERAQSLVFGKGPAHARIVIVGEQPTDLDDRRTEPFSGPERAILESALTAAGVRLDDVYLTHALKHFKHQETNGIRQYKKPEPRDVAACRPWLAAELQLIKPEIIICLGSSAALSVLGRMIRLADERGKQLQSTWSTRTFVTENVAAVLNIKDEDERASAVTRFFTDMNTALASS